MTTSAVYDLIPNEDGGQNTRYPLGDKPAAEVAPPVPTFLATSGETITSIDLNWGQLGDGHTKFILQRWRLNTDTAWTTLTEPGKDDRNYTDSADLLEGQHVGYRIAASDGTNQSAWAPESWTYVLRTPVDPGDAIMFDDFNSYAIGDSVVNKIPPVAAPGVKWNWNAGSPVLVGADGRNGGNCLHFNFKAHDDQSDGADLGHSYCEQQLRLCDSANTAHQEIWVEFWLNTSTMTRVRSSNDKLCAMHNVNYAENGRAAYGRQAGIANTWGGDTNDRYGTITFSNYDDTGAAYDSWPHPYGGGGVPPYGPFGYNGPYSSWWRNYEHAAERNVYGEDVMAISADQAGTWVRYRFNYKCNDNGTPNGHYRFWKDNGLIQEVFQIQRDFRDNYERTDGLYLLGYFNAGFAAPTTWKIDDVSVYATDPGWTF